MFEDINRVLIEKNILSHKNQGITVAKVHDALAGVELTKAILSAIIDKKIVLYLSGGSLKNLYEELVKKEKIIPGAVGLVDERYGEKFHTNSNEKMIQDTQFLRYLHARDIPFYPILQNKPRVETAEAYDEKFRELTTLYPKSVGLLGIGPDGHTAGLPAQKSKVKSQKLKMYTTHDFVVEYYDENIKPPERVTMTFWGLSMLDVLIVAAFGKSKEEAFEAMFRDGPEEEIPARFFKRPDIARKTLLITDQTV